MGLLRKEMKTLIVEKKLPGSNYIVDEYYKVINSYNLKKKVSKRKLKELAKLNASNGDYS
jgi:predicted nucleic acid-binding protein